jgi:histone-arginine methyltransferase CARM1
MDAATRDHFSQPVVGQVDPASLLTPETNTMTIDFTKDTPASLHRLVQPFDFKVTKTGLCHGLASWFDVIFDGSTERVVLTTEPSAPITHWWQCRLLLRDPLAINAGQRIGGSLTLVANERYSYNALLEMNIAGSEATTGGAPISASNFYDLGNQLYHY